MKKYFWRRFLGYLIVGYLVFGVLCLLGEVQSSALAQWQFHAAFLVVVFAASALSTLLERGRDRK